MSPWVKDWETWIRVTASLEQLWTKKVPSEVYHQQLPEFLQEGWQDMARIFCWGTIEIVKIIMAEYGTNTIEMVILMGWLGL